MQRAYEIKPLAGKHFAKAYPLIQAACPDVTLEAWIDYAARLTGTAPPIATAGIVVAECGRGYIHGLFSYMVRYLLNHSAVLTVENFIAVDFGDRDAAMKSLIAGMDRLAQDHGCTTIHTHIPDHNAVVSLGNPSTQNQLHAAGHRIGSVSYCKSLSGA